jgi:NAD+ kinase
MKIAIHGKSFTEEGSPFVQEVFAELTRRGAQIFVSQRFHRSLQESAILAGDVSVYKSQKDIKNVDFIFSLGGDGTLLETVTHVGHLEIPILGINLGRLGFLATIAKSKIKYAIEALYCQTYTLDQRSLISLESNKPIFNGQNFSLNEFTILKKDTSSMITVHTYIDGNYLNSYWADGLIVSTPTGSTGYSLSCGGPVVHPGSGTFVITPVSPHNLNVRPIVVSDESVISFEIEGRSKQFLVALDSRSRAVDDSIQMSVRKEKFCARLVKLNGYNYLDTLRQKLNWGYDIRN